MTLTPDLTEVITLHRLEHVSGIGPYAKGSAQWPDVERPSYDVPNRNPMVGAQAYSCHTHPKYKATVDEVVHSNSWYNANNPEAFKANPWAYACPSAEILCQWFGIPLKTDHPEWRYVVVTVPAENVLVSDRGEQALYRADLPHTRTELSLVDLNEAYHAEQARRPREERNEDVWYGSDHDGPSDYCEDCKGTCHYDG